jgi:hypothetical protein
LSVKKYVKIIKKCFAFVKYVLILWLCGFENGMSYIKYFIFAAKNFKRREIMVKRRLLAASLATIVCLGGE